ncbi:hypothetical protein QNO07_04340 [Streptomyces sp. 549]|uniref:hypothetical protein n=1 Tax=Streptomyces sp. 549 TaxID=3049076 RepID=UPI0024C2E06D|nr:hypothetical protein [Streptomyces sp. 549]MDK1472661.1 hypothetical protein [Streptomyces sp. 549]
MEQLSGAVCDLAAEVVSVLTGGDHRPVAGSAAMGGDETVGVAAVRVLGADVLLPSTIFRRAAAQPDLDLVLAAVRAYPPGPGASVSTAWSHWAMTHTLRQVAGKNAPTWPDAVSAETEEPDASWLSTASWQELTHQLAVLGALAVPAASSRVAVEASRRPVDISRGFVRAVRRRDWLQAAGAARWLAVTGGVPDSLGLDAGLEFVLHMGGADPRVALHAHAAQLMLAGGER